MSGRLVFPRRRGWVLFEMMVALTIFIFTSIAVLGAVSQGLAAAQRTAYQSKAVDLARSTMSKLEAGLGTVQNLSGPVAAWEPGTDGEASSDGSFDESSPANFADTPPEDSPWVVEIDTVPSQFQGLTHVVVTVVRHASAESDVVVASYSLHQLVRIAPKEDDSVGGLDEIGSSVPSGPGGTP